MARIPLGIPEFEVDGGYLPGADETSELADSLTTTDEQSYEGPEASAEQIDETIFAAMLHP